jgi:hypothetical protein
VTYGSGRIGQAGYFDGVNTMAVIPESSVLKNLKTFTLSAWIYPTGLPVAPGYPAELRYYPIIVRSDITSTDFALELNYQGKLHSRMGTAHNNGNGTGSGFQMGVLSDQVIPLNQWSHVAVNYTGSSLQLWINGYIVKEESTVGVPPTWTVKPIKLGQDNGGYIDEDSHFMGYIDEVRVYNSQLSANDIRYLDDAPYYASPRGYWPLDNDFSDISGNGNNGTNINGVTLGGGQISSAGVLNPSVYAGSSYIQLPAANFNNMQSFTLSAWINPTKYNTMNPIISKVDPNRDFVFEVDSVGRLNAHFAINGNEYHQCTSTQLIPLNQWTYVAAIWNGATWSLYINGNCVQTASGGGKVPAWTGTRMGIGTMDYSYNFSGSIDEVKVFPGALQADMIYDTYWIGFAHERNPM